MFEDSTFDSTGRTKTTSPLTIAVSFLLQSLAVGGLLLLPLIYTEALPLHRMTSFLMAPPLRPAAPSAAAVPAVRVIARTAEPPQPLQQPVRIPQEVANIQEEPQPPAIAVGMVPDDTAVVEVGNLVPRTTLIVDPPPPPAPETPARIQVGGLVAAAKLLSRPKPVYPPLARQARIQGTVRLQAIISTDGTIENLTVLSGHPLLIPAALEAVRQWRYQPTLLNGVPVEVETSVDVHFTLGGP